MTSNMFKASLLIGMTLVGSQPALAESGDILIRGRVLYVMPNDNSGLIRPGFGAIPSGVSVDSNIGAELAATYFLTSQIGLEFGFAGSKLDLAGDQGSPAQGDLATAKFIMPTVSLQYYFMPDAVVRPYVGAGVNYIRYYDETPGSVLDLAVVPPINLQPSVSLEGKFGYHAQIGVDIPVNDRFFVNLDVKYIRTDTTAKFVTSDLDFVDVNINPIVFGLGLGFRF